jgi:leucyl/phenylalanyl-tRNA--protein transferase
MPSLSFPHPPNHPPALTPNLLLRAYQIGAFPMGDPDTGEVHWYSPDPRAILPLDGFRIRRSLRKVLKQQRFVIRSDRAFEAVMRGCAAPRPGGEQETWITEDLIAAYRGLHHVGFAHSVEAWLPNEQGGEHLVGGLYGVSMGGVFFGESMFHRADLGGRDASKVATVYLVAHLQKAGFTLLDTQFHNEHLEQFGCIEIPRTTYLERLKAGLRQPACWSPFRPTLDDALHADSWPERTSPAP